MVNETGWAIHPMQRALNIFAEPAINAAHPKNLYIKHKTLPLSFFLSLPIAHKGINSLQILPRPFTQQLQKITDRVLRENSRMISIITADP
jgi:hypothetical protein